MDIGLVYRGAGFLTLAEVVYYRNTVDDLIRFVQNSQYVSRPLNIGRAELRGVEMDWERAAPCEGDVEQQLIDSALERVGGAAVAAALLARLAF